MRLTKREYLKPFNKRLGTSLMTIKYVPVSQKTSDMRDIHSILVELTKMHPDPKRDKGTTDATFDEHP